MSAPASATAAVLRTIYRQCLRLSRDLDRGPFGKALLLAQPAHLFDRRARTVIELPALNGWNRLLERYNGGEFYAPHASSAVDAVRASRHDPSLTTLPGEDPIDVGFTAIKSLGLAVSGGEKLAALGFDCGTPSAVDEVTSCRPASQIRSGCLLVTHPVSCLRQPTLHHAVILIISADDDGVTGLVINKPLDVTLGAAVADEMHEKIGDTLCASTVYRGGDVSERQLLLLHELPGLPDSNEVVDGLYATSAFSQVKEALDEHAAKEMEMAARMVAGGGGSKDVESLVRSSRTRVKCVAGFAGWARHQLEAELERNVWFLVEADDVASLAMMEANASTTPSPQPPAATSSGGEEGSEEGENQDGGGEEGKSGSSASDWLRDAMWSGVMRQLGGEYAALSRFPGDHELIFKHMEQLWDEQNSLLHRRIDMLGEPEGSGSGDKED